MNLRLAPCTFAEARQAVQDWHYSRSLPGAHVARYGVHEDDRYIGSVIFGTGSTPNIGKPYGLPQSEVCELVRVALDHHVTPTSKVVAVALRLLRNDRPEIKLVVSYADPEQGHHGGIYQAGNWTCVGTSSNSYRVVCPDGVTRHSRSAIDIYGSCRGFPIIHCAQKHKYVYVLDPDFKPMVESMRRPYPKRGTSIEGDATGIQPG